MITKLKFIPLLTLILYPIVSNATYPTDNFESYSLSDLNGQNGGSGWTGNWGATTCGSSFDAQNSVVQEGSQAAIGANNGHTCNRNFTATSDETNYLKVYIRSAQTNKANSIWLTKDGNINIIFYQYNDGTFSVYDNLTVTSISSYNANTWYEIEIWITSYANETFKVRINEGTWSSEFHFYNYLVLTNTESNRFWMDMEGGTDTYYVDNISQTTPGGGSPSLGITAINYNYSTTSMEILTDISIIFFSLLTFLVTAITTYIIFYKFI